MSAAEICLQNSIIVQRILKHINGPVSASGRTPDPVKNLKLRFVNKTFNSELLRRIRRAHRNIRMLIPWAPDWRCGGTGCVKREDTDVEVNGHRADFVKIFDYIRFLREVVNVKVDNLEMINFWGSVSCEGWRERFHDEIHKLLENQSVRTFVGMREVCEGCERCYALVRHCSVYGPYQTGLTELSVSYQEDVHFPQLIVDERLLDYIASSELWSSENRESLMKKLINPHFSCDQLCFETSETVYNEDRCRIPSQPLPVEIVDEMCNVWKAESIEIKFGGMPINRTRSQVWSERGMFTPVWLDQLSDKRTDKRTDNKKRKFASVTIDTQISGDVYLELFYKPKYQGISYSNLIENVRRVFPTDKIIIIGFEVHRLPSFYPRFLKLNQDNFEKILKAVWRNKGHLKATIRQNLPKGNVKSDYELPDSIDMLGRRLKCTLLPGTLYSGSSIGRTYRITDETGEKTLDLELMVVKSTREMVEREGVRRGMLKHFQ